MSNLPYKNRRCHRRRQTQEGVQDHRVQALGWLLHRRRGRFFPRLLGRTGHAAATDACTAAVSHESNVVHGRAFLTAKAVARRQKKPGHAGFSERHGGAQGTFLEDAGPKVTTYQPRPFQSSFGRVSTIVLNQAGLKLSSLGSCGTYGSVYNPHEHSETTRYSCTHPSPPTHTSDRSL